VLLQLVCMPAELLGADGILLLERLSAFHDAVKLRYYGIEFLVQLFLHKLADGFQNDVCLLGKAFIQLFVKLLFELAELGV
jgi:hypothetical protein